MVERLIFWGMFNMKGVYLSLLLITLISSCKSYKYEVSSRLQPYVDEYFEILAENDIKVKKRDFKVVFDTSLVKTPYAGVAHGPHAVYDQRQPCYLSIERFPQFYR